ncbi:MAG: hypothetical protein JSU00_09645 [Acidobacteria bacterium]|nr:hypothetical protein [Acidobacteriota bacterium]
MPPLEPVTVTLPAGLVREIDRRQRDRGKFVAAAVRREVDRLRREELQLSLENPHPESIELAGQGLEDWGRSLPEDDPEGLVDLNSGTPVKWTAGIGWLADPS